MGIESVDATQSRWQKSAACIGVPSYIFFSEETNLPDFHPNPDLEGKTFRDFCDECPVKRRCEQFAVLHDTYGVWGGMTMRQREKMYSLDERWEMRDYTTGYSPLYGHS